MPVHVSRVVILARLVSKISVDLVRLLTVLLSLVIDAALGEILTTCSKMEWLIKHGEKAIRTETRPSNFMMFYKKSQVVYEPLGVVSAIVSWNYRMFPIPSFYKSFDG
jgi:acyl-CoA reductase-like NAD-dependent aldehyde dehydrogenase